MYFRVQPRLPGFLVFYSDPGLTSLSGAVIALGGMSVYTCLELKELTNGGKRIPSTSKQSSQSLKSKLNEEKLETTPLDLRLTFFIKHGQSVFKWNSVLGKFIQLLLIIHHNY